MTKRIVVGAALIVGIAGLSWLARSSVATAQDDAPLRVGQTQTDRQQFMRGKLAMVNKIVEGIATDDFELIEKGGMELVALAESADWKSSKDPYYHQYSANFEHATRGLIEAAKAKSVEKATFAYMHVTISCTACHQHVRGVVRVAQ